MASKLAASSSSDNEAAAPPAPSRSDSLPGVPKVSDEVKIKQMWQAEEALSVEARRKRYACGSDYITVDKLQSWESYVKERLLPVNLDDVEFPYDQDLNQRVCLWPGNSTDQISAQLICQVTRLEIDGIQNAANKSMLGGGGMLLVKSSTGSAGSAPFIRRRDVYRLHHGCETGQTKITRAYDLPSKYVLYALDHSSLVAYPNKSHTVGPIGENAQALDSCYNTTLDVAARNHVRTLALCGVSTGIYGYPGEAATKVALNAVRRWLQTGENRNAFDRIIFCIFTPQLLDAYEHHMPRYFPPAPTPVEVTLVWPWGGYRVQIAGVFNGWQYADTNYDEKSKMHEFKLKLLPGSHQYKWIIDGEWKYDGERPICRDSHGNVNNFILL